MMSTITTSCPLRPTNNVSKLPYITKLETEKEKKQRKRTTFINSHASL